MMPPVMVRLSEATLILDSTGLTYVPRVTYAVGTRLGIMAPWSGSAASVNDTTFPRLVYVIIHLPHMANMIGFHSPKLAPTNTSLLEIW